MLRRVKGQGARAAAHNLSAEQGDAAAVLTLVNMKPWAAGRIKGRTKKEKIK